MDSLIDYLQNNHDQLLYVIGAIALVVELGVIGLSGPLLFFSLGCLATGLLVNLSVIAGWELEVLSVGLLTATSTLLLWKPLKHFQGDKFVPDTSSDMIGQMVPVSEPVTINGGKVRHSGINWNARLSESAAVEIREVGLRVKIVAVDGTILIIE
ncbi:putative activity regulator of membrane protease YbbK [Moritella sp. JT01]|uniref:NfeD family protein n=1 Tax=Moritella sp. JT01 TaxID=756698 RepID=UPI00079494C4|nr:NfeD family protein [Moritella sp. JT01]KXO13380.1 putative activity regulator of membrane protease YbbK [Moritella sp. JT01]